MLQIGVDTEKPEEILHLLDEIAAHPFMMETKLTAQAWLVLDNLDQATEILQISTC